MVRNLIFVIFMLRNLRNLPKVKYATFPGLNKLTLGILRNPTQPIRKSYFGGFKGGYHQYKPFPPPSQHFDPPLGAEKTL